MTAEASGGNSARKVELDGKGATGWRSEAKDLEKGDYVAFKESEEKDGDQTGVFFVSNYASLKDLALDGESDARDAGFDCEESTRLLLDAGAIVGEDVAGDHVKVDGSGGKVEVQPLFEKGQDHVEDVAVVNSETRAIDGQDEVDPGDFEEDTSKSDTDIGAQGTEIIYMENCGEELFKEQCQDNGATDKEAREESHEEEVNLDLCFATGMTEDGEASTAVGTVADEGAEPVSVIEIGEEEADTEADVEVEAVSEIAIRNICDQMMIISTVKELEEPRVVDAHADAFVEPQTRDEADNIPVQENAIAEIHNQPVPESVMQDDVINPIENNDQAESGTDFMVQGQENMHKEPKEHNKLESTAHTEEKLDAKTSEVELKDDTVFDECSGDPATVPIVGGIEALSGDDVDSPHTHESSSIYVADEAESTSYVANTSEEILVADHMGDLKLKKNVGTDLSECPGSSNVSYDIQEKLYAVPLIANKNQFHEAGSRSAVYAEGPSESQPEPCHQTDCISGQVCYADSEIVDASEKRDIAACTFYIGSIPIIVDVEVGADPEIAIRKVGDQMITVSTIEELEETRTVDAHVETFVEPPVCDEDEGISVQETALAELHSQPVLESLMQDVVTDPIEKNDRAETIDASGKRDIAVYTLYNGSTPTSVVFPTQCTAQQINVRGGTEEFSKDFHHIDNSTVSYGELTENGIDGQLVHEDAEVVEDIGVVSEDHSASAMNKKEEMHLPKRQSFYIIKIPSFSQDELSTRIQHAQSQLDEKTKNRDSVRVSIQKKKETCGERRKVMEAAKSDERAVGAAYTAKQQEVNSLQSMINNLNQEISIIEIDEMIEMKERSLQHETMSLKQEKLYIREIKELKTKRKHLSLPTGSKAEFDEACIQPDQIFERLWHLMKELDNLGSDLARAKSDTKAARKNHDDEQQQLKDLIKQHDAAYEIRQKAYRHLCNLKSEANNKRKHFYMYKDDKRAAENYKFAGDKEGLQLFCNKQVERIMELWNNNVEFRRHYVDNNMSSTVKRLGTFDGRSLGPDEEPPVLISNLCKRPSSDMPLLACSPPTHDVVLEETVADSVPLSASKEEDLFPILQPAKSSQNSVPLSVSKENNLFPVLQPAKRSQVGKTKGNANVTMKKTVTSTVSDRDEVEDAEKLKACKEEEELAGKANEREEELRKENAAAEKEHCQLEQRAKAKEAEERKQLMAQKAKAREEIKAAKEAEIREKKRVKRAEKKARKKAKEKAEEERAAESNVASGADNCAPEVIHEPEATDSNKPLMPQVAPRKRSKVEPVPLALALALRRKGKRKMSVWIWVLLASLLVLALFFAASYIPALISGRI